MKTILITGGYGFIGSHFVRQFLKKHSEFKVVNLDKLTYAGNPDNLKDIKWSDHYKFVKGDIADKKTVETIFKKLKPDFVVNFAAESHVDRSIHGHANLFVESNIYGVFNLLEAALRQAQGKLKKFVQISTDEVYGSLPLNSKTKFTETTQYNPRSPYSASKAAGDLLCHSYFVTYGLPVVITHSSNNYGSYQYPEKLIPFFALRALKGKPLPLYGDGKNVRDWIYVLDNVEAIERVLFKGKPGEIYNIGGDNEVANVDIARRILNILTPHLLSKYKYGWQGRSFSKGAGLKKPDSLIKYVADRPGHDRRYALDSSKIKKELDWQPKYSFDKMLGETVKWYRDNPKWVRSAVMRLKKVNPHIEI